jgi:hypothetical protein
VNPGTTEEPHRSRLVPPAWLIEAVALVDATVR